MSVKRKYNKANIHIGGKFVPTKKGKFIVDAEYVRDDRTDESLIDTLEQSDAAIEANSEAIEETSKEINERIDNMFTDGKIKSDLLPSYVDDIIEGYYYNGAFYLDSEHTQEIQGESGKIYSDISVTPAVDYRWGGSAYVVHHAQADWGQSDATKPDYIKNKPSIPADPVQSDWNQTDDTKLDYIKNKPTIPAAQIQADWNQSDNSALDFIKNKPLPVVEFKKQSNNNRYDLLTDINLSNYGYKSVYIICYNNNNTIYFTGIGTIVSTGSPSIQGIVSIEGYKFLSFYMYHLSDGYVMNLNLFRDTRMPTINSFSWVNNINKTTFENNDYCNVHIYSAFTEYQSTITCLFVVDRSDETQYNNVKDLDVYISPFDTSDLTKARKLLLNGNPVKYKDINNSLLFFHVGNPLNPLQLISVTKLGKKSIQNNYGDIFNRTHELSALTDLDDLITDTALIKDHTYYITGGTDVYLATSNATCIKYSGSVYPVV